jgi:hypothetical protein
MRDRIRAIVRDHGRLTGAVEALRDSSDLYQAGKSQRGGTSGPRVLTPAPDRVLRAGDDEHGPARGGGAAWPPRCVAARAARSATCMPSAPRATPHQPNLNMEYWLIHEPLEQLLEGKGHQG